MAKAETNPNDGVIDYHVMSREGGRWAVSRAGSSRAVRVLDNREKAISYARKLVKRGSIYVHRKDGWVDVERSIVRPQEHELV